MSKVKFLTDNIEAECASNENIFKCAKRVGAQVSTACSGVGSCGLCRIKIVDGEDCLNAPTKIEGIHLGNVYHLNKVRLACQCKFIKDGEVAVEKK